MNKKLWPRLALLGVAIIWGSSMVVVKTATESLPSDYLVTLRTLLACIALCLLFPKHLKKLDWSYLLPGIVIGGCLFLAYWIQTLSVVDGMPGKSTVLAAIYCVLVPFLAWIVCKRRPNLCQIAAAVLCIVGVGVAANLSLRSLTIEQSDLYALISSFFYAAHIVTIDRFGEKKDPILLTIVQFFFCSVFGWIVTLVREGGVPALPMRALGDLAYLAFMCTGVALLLQNLGQSKVEPTTASILMSTESLFGVLFSVWFAGETLTVTLLCGFVLIFGAILLSQTDPAHLKLRRPKK